MGQDTCFGGTYGLAGETTGEQALLVQCGKCFDTSLWCCESTEKGHESVQFYCIGNHPQLSGFKQSPFIYLMILQVCHQFGLLSAGQFFWAWLGSLLLSWLRFGWSRMVSAGKTCSLSFSSRLAWAYWCGTWVGFQERLLGLELALHRVCHSLLARAGHKHSLNWRGGEIDFTLSWWGKL